MPLPCHDSFFHSCVPAIRQNCRMRSPLSILGLHSRGWGCSSQCHIQWHHHHKTHHCCPGRQSTVPTAMYVKTTAMYAQTTAMYAQTCSRRFHTQMVPGHMGQVSHAAATPATLAQVRCNNAPYTGYISTHNKRSMMLLYHSMWILSKHLLPGDWWDSDRCMWLHTFFHLVCSILMLQPTVMEGPSPALCLRDDVSNDYVDHGSRSKCQRIGQYGFSHHHNNGSYHTSNRLNHATQLTVPETQRK